MLTHTGTKQRSDDRTTNLSRLIMIGNLRIYEMVEGLAELLADIDLSLTC